MMSENKTFAATAAVASSVTKESLSTLLDQMTLTRAAELARSGHYAEAKEVLSAGKDKTRYSPAALDLLARIHAQQGRLAEAEKLWTRASVLDPANSAYVLALRRTASVRNDSRRAVIMVPLVACLILCVLIGLWWWQRRAKVRTAGAASTQNSEVQSPATSRDIESAALRTSIQNGINVPGITVTKRSNGLTLSFDDGLFQRGLILKPGAREKLGELGRQLKSYTGNSAVQIIGMTDELPMPRYARYRDNVSLGMDRARFVYDYLRFISKLDSRDFAIGSSDSGGQTPDHSDRAINRARSRTVVLHIDVVKRS